MAAPAAAASSFLNYPVAQEAADLANTWEEDSNPPMRGLPLVLGSMLVCRTGFLQRYLWANAGFGKPKNIPALAAEQWRFQPTVIPVSDDPSAYTMLEPGPELRQIQPLDRPGRFHSAADYHELYRSGEATPLQVAEALLPLVQRGQTPPSKYELAFLASNVDDVLAAARASTERWAAGAPLGPLDGVPISVKADIRMRGYLTTFGMRVDGAHPFFREPARETDWPVRKLMEAGAVVVAQNNMHEVGMDPSGCNPRTGTPVNWYNKTYFPGGSSSGAGSALGAGLVPIAVGTDSGGSVRIPPAFNGAYGLKPSHGRTMTVNSTMCIVGPMAANVADLTAAYRVMSQPNPDDPVQGRFAVSRPPPPPPGTTTSSAQKKVIGIHRAWVSRSKPAALALFDRLVEHLRDARGYEVVDIDLPHLQAGQRAHAATCLTEGLDDARSRVSSSSSSTGDPDPNGWAALLNHPNRLLFSIAQNTPAPDYLKYGQLRELLMRHLAHLFRARPGLVVLTPATADVGWPKRAGDDRYGMTDGNATMRSMQYVWLSNTTGCPSVTCPVGYAEPEQGEGRVPVAVLAMGEWGAEEQLLSFAAETEEYLHGVYPGGRLRPEEWVDVPALARERARAKGVDGVDSVDGADGGEGGK